MIYTSNILYLKKKKKKATYLRELYHTSKKYILESLIVFFFL
jgi:hypothetical protein